MFELSTVNALCFGVVFILLEGSGRVGANKKKRRNDSTNGIRGNRVRPWFGSPSIKRAISKLDPARSDTTARDQSYELGATKFLQLNPRVQPQSIVLKIESGFISYISPKLPISSTRSKASKLIQSNES